MVEIAAYNPAWPEEFRAIAGKLRAAVGSAALRIDHIGSTAVPGLAAKDVIDVQITAAALDGELLKRMTSLGYSHAADINCDHCPPHADAHPDQWRKWFFRAPAGQRSMNTHVRLSGRANQRFALLFRDYLRTHPATAEAYAELKRQLARELRDGSAYPDVKDPAVDLIYLAAGDWAEVTWWRMGASDA
jgi:GrpB-like predicted nucleotidyltransferase (UPF0157 family)